MTARPKRVPVAAAKRIAKQYGYDQVLIVTRKVGPDGVQWHTTYGRNREHCDAASRIMRWLEQQMDAYHDPEKRALIEQIISPGDVGLGRDE